MTWDLNNKLQSQKASSLILLLDNLLIECSFSFVINKLMIIEPIQFVALFRFLISYVQYATEKKKWGKTNLGMRQSQL